MLATTRTLPFVLLLSLGTAVYAQDTTTAEETEAEQTQAAEPAENAEATEAESDTTQADPSVGLDLGTEVQQDATYVKAEYGDWQLQCFRAEESQEACQMYQLLRESAGNPVAEFSVFKLPNSSQAVAGATIAVPLGTLLPQGLRIRVDDGTTKSYNFAFCTQAGCFARIGFTQADIATFKAGVTATLEIVPAQAPDQTVQIIASLAGFTAAFNEVSIAPNQ
ncbi:MAG: invasion associated locus B family protein [Pseudomonadota bacterium]